MSTGGCARNSAASMVSKATGQTDGLDRRALCHRRPAAPALAVRRAGDRSTALILKQKIDAVYVTRFQKERWAEKDRPYPKIDAKFLDEPKYSEASVMHPLPRVNELDASLDTDRRAIYFEQAAYGVPVRMALISLLLHLHKEQVAAPIRRRLRQAEHRSTRSRSAPASNAPTRTASPAIRPSGNTPPTSSIVVEEKSPPSAAGCAASIARPTSTSRSGRPFRRRRHRHGRPIRRVGGARAVAGREAQAPHHSTAAKPKRWPPAFPPREGGKKGARRLASGAAEACLFAVCPFAIGGDQLFRARASCQTCERTTRGMGGHAVCPSPLRRPLSLYAVSLRLRLSVRLDPVRASC